MNAIKHLGKLALPEGYDVISGEDMFLRIWGEGDPLILLHGNHGSGYSFTHMIPTLRRSYQLIVPDMPGCGNGPAMTSEYAQNPILSVAYILEIIGFLQLERVMVCGHSLGGMTGLMLTAHHPALVNALVLLDSFVNFHERPEQLFRLNAFPGAAREVREEVADAADDGAEVQWYADFDMSNLIKNIVRPVLELQGESNPDTEMLFKNWCIEKRSGIPEHWRIKRIYRAGHFLHIEQPEQVLTQIIDFLRGI